MKRIYPFLFIAFITFSEAARAQAPSWQWVQSAAGGGDLESHAVAADHAGNVYASGWYYNSAPQFGAQSLPYSPDGDMFLVRYDRSGNALWAQGTTGTGFDEARAIAVDAWGNVYVTGIFDSPLLTIGGVTLTNADSTTIDIFLAKYDSTGIMQWARSVGGVEREFAEGLAVDYQGNVVVTGSFEGDSVLFGGIMLHNVNPSTEDIFIAKYDPAGNILWAKAVNGPQLDWATCVATDPKGHVFFAGPSYSDTLFFDGAWLAPAIPGNEWMFVVKLDTNGGVLWMEQVSGNSYFNEPYSLATDAFGSLFLAGTSNSDTVSLSSITLTNALAGGNDIILAKYDSAGSGLWAKKAGGYSSDYGYSLATDASGMVYLTGFFDSDTLRFDSVAVAVNPSFYSDMFVVKVDESGSVDWLKSTGGIYQPASFGYPQQGLCLNDSGDIFTVGSFIYDSLAFDADTLFLNGSGTNFYLAKLNDAGACAAHFTLYPDSLVPHLYWIINQASGTPPLSYLWSWGDGTTDTIAYPSHTYAVEGFYPVCLTITDSSGCTNTVCHTWNLQRNENTMVQVNVVESIPVSVGELKGSDGLIIYPNPAGNRFTIRDSRHAIEELEIVNSLGKRIHHSWPGRTSMEIDCREYSSGVYFVKIKNEKGMAVKKIIVE